MRKHTPGKSGGRKNAGGADNKSPRKRLHQDWRTWVVVVLMLAAMGIYVVTLDDSVVPVVQTLSKTPGSTSLPSQP
jgi:hypothetical protein